MSQVAAPFRLAFRVVDGEIGKMWEARLMPAPELIKAFPTLPDQNGMPLLQVPLRCSQVPELREQVIGLVKSIAARMFLEQTGDTISFSAEELDLEGIPPAGRA